ncbi:MlaD family protein [Mucilaginibacter sp. BT774]|uniref:MlaD family protein n=1 Tax=Mucilaginibacter sp. BT774 TaxID=3062276 RepID=UPI002675210A|nr:MlaD family protein [Mucilaginibacter sp. BT774]MDO3628223.1 MlaD family protein [Mucilaginibacter sp. BT774]
MANQGENNIRLGAFVLAGLLALIFTLYMIGENRSLFGSNFELRARFANINGLIEGNNVLFSGIQAGTVKQIKILNDTSIEVVMRIDNKIRPFIHKNARASIGTQGLMGDKIINIVPGKGALSLIEDNDLIETKKISSTDEILETLSKTSNNIADISESLKNAVQQFDKSAAWSLLNNKTLKNNIESTLKNIEQTSISTREMTQGLNDLVSRIKQGKGNAGLLLKDSTLATNLNEAVSKIRQASDNANQVTVQMNKMVSELNGDLHKGKGVVKLLLNDSVTAKNLSISMENIKKGTDGFNQNMEALKHNFLLRGYFKNLEKQKQKKADTVRKK